MRPIAVLYYVVAHVEYKRLCKSVTVTVACYTCPTHLPLFLASPVTLGVFLAI